MKKISVILSVLILLLATQPARSQAGKLFDIDHLQSGVFINQLYVDKEGFLWALTSNGALQYDGYKFNIDAEVHAVQTHNVVDAIKSAWGVDVKVVSDDGMISLQ